MALSMRFRWNFDQVLPGIVVRFVYYVRWHRRLYSSMQMPIGNLVGTIGDSEITMNRVCTISIRCSLRLAERLLCLCFHRTQYAECWKVALFPCLERMHERFPYCAVWNWIASGVDPCL